MNKIKVLLIGLAAAVTGFLGAWAGAEGTNKNWRRLGIPLLLTILGVCYKGWWGLLLFIFYPIYTIGYGIPDPGYPDDPNADKGSPLGRFWYWVTKKNQFLSDIFTRGTIGVLKAGVLIALAILTGGPKILLLSVPIVIAGNMLSFAWRVFGSYKIFGKNLTWDETLVHICDGLAAAGQIII